MREVERQDDDGRKLSSLERVCARWVFALRALRAQEARDTAQVGGQRGELRAAEITEGAFKALISGMWQGFG